MGKTDLVEIQIHLLSGEEIKFAITGTERDDPSARLTQFIEGIKGQSWVNLKDSQPATGVPVRAIAYVTATKVPYYIIGD